MVSVKALDELTPADLWQAVPHDEDFWEDSGERLRALLKHLMQGALEEEQLELLAASRYRRVELRRGYRNGYYERDLVTQLGVVQGIRVPRARGLRSEHRVFARYQRRQREVNDVIRDVFLRGVSTREVGRVLGAMLGEEVSAERGECGGAAPTARARRRRRPAAGDPVRGGRRLRPRCRGQSAAPSDGSANTVRIASLRRSRQIRNRRWPNVETRKLSCEDGRRMERPLKTPTPRRLAECAPRLAFVIVIPSTRDEAIYVRVRRRHLTEISAVKLPRVRDARRITIDCDVHVRHRHLRQVVVVHARGRVDGCHLL